MAGAGHKFTAPGFIAMAVLLALTGAAQADLKLCNRMSYVVDAAIGLDNQGKASTRGWFHLNPGDCKLVLEGDVPADQIYVHARIPSVYGAPPLASESATNFCVGTGTFAVPEAHNCRFGQTVAPFFPIRPSEMPDGLVAYLAEDSEYTDIQARDAGIQRLLVIAGYDANPIDGIRGDKTDAVLTQFLRDNNLPPTAAGRSDFFDTLIDVAQKPGIGLSWCNETKNAVMAALGSEDRSGLTTRGWYRIEPGKCVRPDVTGRPLRLYSYGEAVDADGQAINRADKTAAWGGDIALCTRNARFELSDRTDCAAKGLSTTGFAPVDFAGKTTAVVTFK